MVVDLPAPLGPRNATISPWSTRRSMSSTAVTDPKDLATPSRRIAGWCWATATFGGDVEVRVSMLMRRACVRTRRVRGRFVTVCP